MSRIALTLALAAVLAPMAAAQQPGGPGPMPMGREGAPGAASMLLSHTADFKLSDAQVTRLAAIARRSGDRRTANRAAIDSLRAQFRPDPQGMPPAGPPAAARALMDRLHTQDHEDLRDALAVLTPDQQASAFETITRRGMMEGGARMRRMGGMGPGGMRQGGRRGMQPGMGPQPGARGGMRQGGPPPGADSLQRRQMRQPPRRPDAQ